MKNNIFIIKSNIDVIPSVVKQIFNKLNENNIFLDNELYFRIKVVLNEIITNSVIHGNCNNEKKKVTIKMHVKDNNIVFRIIDQGAPFCGQHKACYDLLKENSRGVAICNVFCDDISYNFIDGVGNAATIKFYKIG